MSFNKILTLILVLFVTACSTNETIPASPSQKERLQDLRTNVSSWALPVTSEEEGDSVLFNGLLCLSGASSACEEVKNSQDSSGRVWRAPARVGVDSSNSFSRDMGYGFLAYLAATKDKEAAKHWQNYLESSKALCPDATDNRCDFTPAFFGLMGDVWDYLNLDKSDSMTAGQVGDDSTIYAQTSSSPEGYQLHLNAVYLFIKKEIGQGNTLVLNAVADKLIERQPKNAFFQYLAGNNAQAARLILSQVPRALPARHNQWSFQRSTSENAWKNSYGQDFLFLLNLLLPQGEK